MNATIFSQFTKQAATSLETRRSKGEKLWRELVEATVKGGSEAPTYDAIRAAAPHMEDSATAELLERFEKDCLLAAEYAHDTGLLAQYQVKVSKVRNPLKIAQEVSLAEQKLETLRAEHSEAALWSGSVDHINQRMKSMRQDRPDLFVK
jgi:hypothetical protein